MPCRAVGNWINTVNTKPTCGSLLNFYSHYEPWTPKKLISEITLLRYQDGNFGIEIRIPNPKDVDPFLKKIDSSISYSAGGPTVCVLSKESSQVEAFLKLMIKEDSNIDQKLVDDICKRLRIKLPSDEQLTPSAAQPS